MQFLPQSKAIELPHQNHIGYRVGERERRRGRERESGGAGERGSGGAGERESGGAGEELSLRGIAEPCGAI